MDTPLTLNSDLARLFNWLTRTSMGRKFGSLPIGWYQMHQCHALNILGEQLTCWPLSKDAPLRVKQGVVQAKANGHWKSLISCVTVFQQADDRTRR